MTRDRLSFLSDSAPLGVGDNVAAMIVLPDGRLVLQERDQISGIWYPGHWALFGGGTEPGESAEAAMRRELKEELEFDAGSVELFFTDDFELPTLRLPPFRRSYFVVPATTAQFEAFRLHEGAGFAAFPPAAILGGMRIVPYDAFAIFLYHARTRIRAHAAPSA